MSRRKLSKENVRKLTRVGGTSLCVTIPMEYVRLLKWKERQRVMVELRGKELVVKDWKN